MFVCSVLHLFIYSFIHSFTHSLIHSFTPSSTHPLTHSPTHPPTNLKPLTHHPLIKSSSTHSPVEHCLHNLQVHYPSHIFESGGKLFIRSFHQSVSQSVTHSLIYSSIPFHQSLSHSLTHSFIRSSPHPFTSLQFNSSYAIIIPTCLLPKSTKHPYLPPKSTSPSILQDPFHLLAPTLSSSPPRPLAPILFQSIALAE